MVPKRASVDVGTAGVLERLGRGGERELLDAVGAAGLLGVVEVRRADPSRRSSMARAA